MSQARRFTQFEALPDVREFIHFAVKQEGATIRFLVNRALRHEMERVGYTPRPATERPGNARDYMLTADRQDG